MEKHKKITIQEIISHIVFWKVDSTENKFSEKERTKKSVKPKDDCSFIQLSIFD